VSRETAPWQKGLEEVWELRGFVGKAVKKGRDAGMEGGGDRLKAGRLRVKTGKNYKKTPMKEKST